MSRLFKIFKDPISGLTHVTSAAAALAGAVVLGVLSPPGSARAALLVYGASLVLMFAASSAYHLVKASPAWDLLLRKLDHTAIFLFIAGTYTPVCVIALTGSWRWGLLIAVWSVAAVGILFKFAFIRHAPRWLSVVIYLLMGWLGVIGAAQLVRAVPLAGLAWLAVGGLLYTGGALVYATKRLDFLPGVFGFHEIWHLFVSAASAAHYIFILGYVLPAAAR